MNNTIQIIAVTVSVLLLALVLELVRRKKLTEEYSFVWVLCALALLGLSIGRRLLDKVALSIGIYYPPAALILVLIFFVFIASLSFSVVVSRQRQQIDRLIEDTALLEERVRQLTEKGDVEDDATALAAAGRRTDSRRSTRSA
jgi:hypothetical protein